VINRRGMERHLRRVILIGIMTDYWRKLQTKRGGTTEEGPVAFRGGMERRRRKGKRLKRGYENWNCRLF